MWSERTDPLNSEATMGILPTATETAINIGRTMLDGIEDRRPGGVLKTDTSTCATIRPPRRNR